MVAPAGRRPTARITWFNRISRPGSIVMGIHMSPVDSNASDAGAMPDDHIVGAIEREMTAHDRSLATESAFPERLADHDDLGTARAVLAFGERSSEHGLDAK